MDSKRLIKMAEELMTGIFDPDDEKVPTRIKNELEKLIPLVIVKVSVLGGKKNAALMILLAFDPKSEWQNNIMENSRYARISIDRNGVMENFSGSVPKMRKATAKDLDDAIAKLKKYIDKVK